MIHQQIKEFMDREDTTLDDLSDFATQLLKEHPQDRRFLQEWFLDVVVKWTQPLFEGVTLVRHNSFSLDATNLGARILYRDQTH